MAPCISSVDESVSTTADPTGLVRHLESNGRFHRDSVVGRMLHPGTISFRERVLENSIHIVIVGNQVSLHVDRYAPLVLTRAGARYSFWRAVAHNVAHLGEDLVRLLTSRRGEHRCRLDCERVETGDRATDGVPAGSPAEQCASRVG